MSPRRAMTCRQMVEHLSDYVDRDLDSALRAAIEAHGGECPPCRAFVNTLAATVKTVRALPRAPLSGAAKRSLVVALRSARVRSLRGRDARGRK